MEPTIDAPHIFDFITIGKDAKGRELENALVGKIRDLLLEPEWDIPS